MNKARFTTLALAIGLALALGSPAWAGQAGASRQKATGSMKGAGLVTARSVSQATLTVDDRTFAVDARTRILDLDGKPISLAKVPLRTDPPFTMNQTEPGAVDYRAISGRNGWTLVEVRLKEAEPR